jgi:hypothetical protein
MTKPLPRGGRVALLLLLPIGLLPLFARVQRTIPQVPSSRFQDWSTRHAVYSQTGTSAALEAARSDPRALFRWREVEQREQAKRLFQPSHLRSVLEFQWRRTTPTVPVRVSSTEHADWSISLGNGATALAMYPAKFSFNTTATPDCNNDFAVFPVNVAGSATQPNLVAFNNLYSGNAGSTGICDGRTTTGFTDTKTSATVLWSYNVSKIAGAVTTSPVISFDNTGSKIAFVESVAGQPAHFHVLAWKSGDGQANNLQSVVTPVTINSFVGSAPVLGSGTATDLALGAATTGTDTLSSPYVDYGNDFAYVGNDVGVLYRVKNVFCTTPACSNAAPTLDTNWGTSGAVTIGGTCTGKLTGPVFDSVSKNVFVGCADGKLYKVTQAGVVSSITVGNGSAHGGIVDSPVVDGVNGFVYAVSGSNGTNAVLVQATTSFSSSVTATLSAASNFNLHAPVVNDAYVDSATPANWLIYEMAYNSGHTTYTLYGMTFSAAHVMSSGAPAHAFNFATGTGELSPSTEFFNQATSVDWLFSSTVGNFNPNLGSWNITPTVPNPSGFPTGQSAAVAPNEGTGGTSGFIVDNGSASAQASSIYFSSIGFNAAVKLTQANLN